MSQLIIIVGVDGTPTAAQAGQTAARLAAAIGARLHVVCAYDRTGSTEVISEGSDRWVLSNLDEATATAEREANALRPLTPDVSSAAVRGKPAEVLVREAERLEADLIVVGNKRVQGLARVLGSVAKNVAQQAPCDVYIAKTV